MAQPLYSTSFNITHFSGLNQTGDGYNMNMQYAREMENVSVEGGSFRPMREGLLMPQELTEPIGTLARLHRRYGAETGTLLVAISNGSVFTKELDGDDAWQVRYTGLTENDCDWLTYETSRFPEYNPNRTYAAGERCDHTEDDVRRSYRCTSDIATAEAWNAEHWEAISVTDPIDILLFSNAKDGMFCLYGDNKSVRPIWITPAPEIRPTENIKFGVIARYNERIWGTGIDGDPDKLMYSTPYDPFNWTANADIPEDGAGDILQPSWDGDRFLALRQYGDNLLAVKRNSIWRIYGTDPSSFTMSQQYGGGTIVENTFVVFNDRAYMLGENGMLAYDGTGAYAFQQETIQDLMQNHVNHAALDKACAWMRDRTYCLALPVNGSEYCNAILEYNTAERTFALRTGVSVDSFLSVNERLFYTSAIEPGRVFELQDRIGPTLFCKWVSGYQDLGMKSSIKSAFIVYMMVESEAPVELRVGIRTEKKLKQKIVVTKPGKLNRIQLNLQGRVFRLEIESYSAVPFTIAGGMKIDMELDPD